MSNTYEIIYKDGSKITIFAANETDAKFSALLGRDKDSIQSIRHIPYGSEGSK